MNLPSVNQIPEASRADFEDCTVTAVSPLRIKRDADAVELAFTPDTLVNTAFLTIGDRVRVDISRNPMLIIGRADGLQNVATVSQLPNPNLLRNGTFRTNQRAYVSGTDLALNAYGFDGWKATTANSRMTFTSAPQGQAVTIPSGDSWGQVIERSDIDAGAHTVSHAGTAQARIYNVGATPPAYADCPVTATLDGTANVIVEFGPGTVDKAKVERGSVATPFVLSSLHDELHHCRKYFRTSYPIGVTPGTADGSLQQSVMLFADTTTDTHGTCTFDPPMRATPTLVVYAANTASGAGTVNRVRDNTAGGLKTPSGFTVSAVGITNFTFSGMTVGRAYGFNYTADAEL